MHPLAGLDGAWELSVMNSFLPNSIRASSVFHEQKIQNRHNSDSDNELYMNNDNWPRYLVITSASEESPVFKLSPFAIQKGFQAIAGTLKSFKRSRDRSFLVECGRKVQATNILKTVKFVDRPVKVSVNKSLNSSQGIVGCRDLKNMSELQIRDELKGQGVVGVHRVTVRKNGEVIPTRTHFLTFNSPGLQKETTVGYLRVKVEPFVPNPRRFFNCKVLFIQVLDARRQQSVSDVQKRNMMDSVMGPKIVPTTVVLVLLQPQIALSGRWRKRFNAFALRNVSISKKPDGWYRRRLQPSVNRHQHRIPVLLAKEESYLLTAKRI